MRDDYCLFNKPNQMSHYPQMALFEARHLLELSNEIEKIKLLQKTSHSEYVKALAELRDILSVIKTGNHHSLNSDIRDGLLTDLGNLKNEYLKSSSEDLWISREFWCKSSK